LNLRPLPCEGRDSPNKLKDYSEKPNDFKSKLIRIDPYQSVLIPKNVYKMCTRIIFKS